MRLKCQNCGYEWKPRVKKPKRCPDCAISKRYGKFKIIKNENAGRKI